MRCRVIGVALVLLVLISISAASAGAEPATSVNEASEESSNTSLNSNGTPVREGSSVGTPGDNPVLEYRDTNGSSMNSGRTTVADFRPASIAIHDWFSIYNPSNVSFSGDLAIALPDEAEVATVTNGSGEDLDYSIDGGSIILRNTSVPAGGSWLIGLHYDVRGNSLTLTSDRHTGEMALFMRAGRASQDQFRLRGPMRMRGPTGNQEGRPEFVATASEVERGEEFGVAFTPSAAPAEKGGEGNDLNVAITVAAALIAALLLGRRSDLGEKLRNQLPDSGSPDQAERNSICPDCGTESRGVFCPSCGKPLKETCPGCGEFVRTDDGFCANCGERL